VLTGKVRKQLNSLHFFRTGKKYWITMPTSSLPTVNKNPIPKPKPIKNIQFKTEVGKPILINMNTAEIPIPINAPFTPSLTKA
jgi:hypothetical protein